MKKIFTLLGGMLLASTITVNAEEVAAYICNDEDTEIAYGFDADLTKSSDGVYTLTNLFGVDEGYGIPFSFKFDQPEVGKSSPIGVTSNVTPIEGFDGAYIKNSNDKHPIFWIYDLNGIDDWVRLRKSYIYYGGSYVYRYDTSDPVNEYEYVAVLAISGTFNGYNEETDTYDKELFTGKGEEAPYLYVQFWFNEPEAEPEVPETPAATLLHTLDVTVYDNGAWFYPDYSDYDTYVDKSLKSFDSKLEIYDDGTYTLKGIYGSDYDISYTFGKFNPKNQAAITFTGNLYREEGYLKYPYFLTPDGGWMTVTVEEETGEKLTVDYLQGSELADYTYIYKCTDAEIAEGYYQYYAYMYISGYVGEKASLDMTVYFGYNDPTTAVSAIETNDNAPVEFFNLNGQRVADPSNGIFIRRQGTKTSKVLIK